MPANIEAEIIEKAKEMGSAAAGIASVASLKKSPSHEILRRFGAKIDGCYAVSATDGFKDVTWPDGAGSALVIAVSHPRHQPELDWFYPDGNTPGNRILININKALAAWIEEAFGIKTHKLPYYVERGGIYLKDAAVLGGLGYIGRNNMLVTPEFGPRVRLRAMLLEAGLTPTGPTGFDPCKGCEEFCRKACPQQAFARMIHSSEEIGITGLPARDGRFSRAGCKSQMDRDVEVSGVRVGKEYEAGFDREEESGSTRCFKHCRRCELACPVGG